MRCLRERRTLSSGIAETRAFNSRNQLTDITAAANSATLFDMSYGYGSVNNGRIRSRTDAVQPEHSATYTFDELDRLEAVSGGGSSWGISWTLDRYGNRTAQNPTGLAGPTGGPIASQSISISASTNRNTGYTYDNAGNVTNDGSHTYSYDAESRLIQIDSSAIQYAYDASGRRIKKIAGGVTTYYFCLLSKTCGSFPAQAMSQACGRAPLQSPGRFESHTLFW